MLTPTERKAASLLMADYPFHGMQTVSAFAEKAGVSNPTILRLVAKLGFRAYADFQSELRDELQARLGSPLMRGVELGVREPTDKSAFGEVGRSVIASIEKSMDGVPIEIFDAVLALLMNKRRRLFFLGGRLTSGVALQSFLYLREMRSNVRTIDIQTAAWSYDLVDMDKRAVLLVFDIRRYQEDVIRFAKHAAGAGATVVLFTDEWLSPIASDAAYIVALRTRVVSNWDTISPFLVFVESLVAQYNVRAWPEVKHRMEQIERARDLLSHKDKNDI